MRRKKYITLAFSLIALLLSGVLISCNSSDGDALTSGQLVTVSFTIRVSEESSTRAVTVEEEEGTGMENYIGIDTGDYNFLIFDTDDKYVTSLTPTMVIPLDDSDYPSSWHVTATFEAADLNTFSSFKLVVLANWGSDAYPTSLTVGTTTIEDVCDATTSVYSYAADYTTNFIAGNESIPMYGVAAFEGNSFSAGLETNVGTVWLIRAMAKVEVIQEVTDTLLQFSSVKINRYNAQGYCAPGDIFSDDDYDAGWALHIVGDANDTDSKEVELVKTSQWEDEDGAIYEKWIAYIPEYMNVGAGDEYTSIQAYYKGLPDSDPGIIYFAEYTDGATNNESDDTRLNVLRDFIYRYNVKTTISGFTLLLTVSNWEGLYENTFNYGSGQITSPIYPWYDEIDNNVEL